MSTTKSWKRDYVSSSSVSELSAVYSVSTSLDYAVDYRIPPKVHVTLFFL